MKGITEMVDTLEQYRNKLKIGNRVKVFDSLRFIDDKTTPLSVTMRKATIINIRYNHTSKLTGYFYEELVDVRFDEIRKGLEHLQGEDKYISKGHFPWGIELLK